MACGERGCAHTAPPPGETEAVVGFSILDVGMCDKMSPQKFSYGLEWTSVFVCGIFDYDMRKRGEISGVVRE